MGGPGVERGSNDDGSEGDHPFAQARASNAIACRLGIGVAIALARLSVRLLPHEHPHRVFVLSLVESLRTLPELRRL